MTIFSANAGPRGISFVSPQGATLTVAPSLGTFDTVKALLRETQTAFRDGRIGEAKKSWERMTELAMSRRAGQQPPPGPAPQAPPTAPVTAAPAAPIAYRIMPGSIELDDDGTITAAVHTGPTDFSTDNLRYVRGNMRKHGQPDETVLAFMTRIYENSEGCLLNGDFRLTGELPERQPEPARPAPSAPQATNGGQWVRITRTLPDRASNAMPKSGTIARFSDEGSAPAGSTALRFEAADLGYVVHNPKDAEERYLTLYIPDDAFVPYAGPLPSHWPVQIGEDDVEATDFSTVGTGKSIIDIEIDKDERPNLLDFVHAAAEAIAAGYGAGNCSPESVAFWWGYALPHPISSNQFLLHIELDSDKLSDEARAAAVRQVTDEPSGEIKLFGKVVGRWQTMEATN